MPIFLSTTSQTWSIGLKSGDCGSSRNQFEMIWALWHILVLAAVRRWAHCGHVVRDGDAQQEYSDRLWCFNDATSCIWLFPYSHGVTTAGSYCAFRDVPLHTLVVINCNTVSFLSQKQYGYSTLTSGISKAFWLENCSPLVIFSVFQTILCKSWGQLCRKKPSRSAVSPASAAPTTMPHS